MKDLYAREFGLPVEQIRFSDELTPERLSEVRQVFGIGLCSARNWVYAVRDDGGLVLRMVGRSEALENDAKHS